MDLESVFILLIVLGLAFVLRSQSYLAGRRDERRGWVKAASAAKAYR